mmetsp:Transcript_39055/g.78101  ORF Transcript_39055/g.78101 Transcript_39055/m.78101 type:complete len:203 (-) Transcript_39055:250-858(-)
MMSKVLGLWRAVPTAARPRRGRRAASRQSAHAPRAASRQMQTPPFARRGSVVRLPSMEKLSRPTRRQSGSGRGRASSSAANASLTARHATSRCMRSRRLSMTPAPRSPPSALGCSTSRPQRARLCCSSCSHGGGWPSASSLAMKRLLLTTPEPSASILTTSSCRRTFGSSRQPAPSSRAEMGQVPKIALPACLRCACTCMRT